MKYFISLIILMFTFIGVKGEELKLTFRTEKELQLSLKSENKSQYLLMIREAKKSLPKLSDTLIYALEMDSTKPNQTNSPSEGIKVIYKGEAQETIKTSNFKPDNIYLIDLYSFAKEKNKWIYKYILTTDTIVTLALEPTETTQKVLFHNVTDTSMMIILKKGDGDNRIVIMKKNRNPVVPADGTIIQAVNGGNKFQNLGDSTLVVYNGKGSTFNIHGLKSGVNYYFYSLEYNGSGKSANYLNRNGLMNPRDQSTLVLPPKVHSPEDISNRGFKISWERVPDAIAYMYEVAIDKEFKEKLLNYEKKDVGTELFDYVDLSKEYVSEVYIRVRVYMKFTHSDWSEPILVKIK